MDKEYIAKIAFNLLQVIRIYNSEDCIETYDNLSEERKSQVICAVEEVLDNPKITAYDVHDVWMEAKLKDGWQYSPVTDREKKQSACLVPFAELNIFQKLKDALFIQIVLELKDLTVLDEALIESYQKVRDDNLVLRSNNKELLNAKFTHMEWIERLEKEVKGLRKSEATLNALENAGVDNWEGFPYAMTLLDDEFKC
jgi:hypothetical protein